MHRDAEGGRGAVGGALELNSPRVPPPAKRPAPRRPRDRGAGCPGRRRGRARSRRPPARRRPLTQAPRPGLAVVSALSSWVPVPGRASPASGAAVPKSGEGEVGGAAPHAPGARPSAALDRQADRSSACQGPPGPDTGAAAGGRPGLACCTEAGVEERHVVGWSRAPQGPAGAGAGPQMQSQPSSTRLKMDELGGAGCGRSSWTWAIRASWPLRRRERRRRRRIGRQGEWLDCRPARPARRRAEVVRVVGAVTSATACWEPVRTKRAELDIA